MNEIKGACEIGLRNEKGEFVTGRNGFHDTVTVRNVSLHRSLVLIKAPGHEAIYLVRAELERALRALSACDS